MPPPVTASRRCNGINDLASVRGIFTVAIQAAKLLNVDAELVPLWQEMLDKLSDIIDCGILRLYRWR